MSNRGYSSNSRRRSKKRVTGRFYALIAIVAILAVGLFVVLPKLRSQETIGPAAQPTPTAGAGGWTAEDVPTPEPAASGGTLSIEEMIQQNPDLAPLEGAEKVQVSDLSINESLPSDWHNVLLLGSDTRNIKRVSRTDTIIIASINVSDGRIKLTSIMRDTVVPIPGHGNQKINSASYYGGPELTMKVVNECFKMNISEYVLVNFGGFREAIDILGGIKLDVTEKERVEINAGLKEQGRLLGLSRETWLAGGYDLKTSGAATQLDGLQALSYARIRHIDTDYERTRRQRAVINAAVQKLRSDVSVTQLVQLINSMWQYFDTNVNLGSALTLATTVLRSGIGEITTGLMPITGSYVSENRKGLGAALYDIDFEANAAKLYEFIYTK